MPVELRFGPVACDSCLNSDCTLKTDGQRARPDGFGTIWTAVALDLVGWGIVLPILPLYAERFTEDTTLVGLLVASFSLMQLVFAPVLGRLSDRYGRKPVLIGVSEGAGLSVLAATDAQTKTAIAGVIALGLPDRNELGWRLKDALVYLTHRVPNEPTFSAASTVGAIAPLPLALVQSTHDEFVPLAETQRIFDRASAPKQLWIVDASNHRFSSNLAVFDSRLMEALEWIRHNQPQ